MPRSSTPEPVVSVVIPARNEEAFVASALESVASQTWPPTKIEAIVVVNGTQDPPARPPRPNRCRPDPGVIAPKDGGPPPRPRGGPRVPRCGFAHGARSRRADRGGQRERGPRGERRHRG